MKNEYVKVKSRYTKLYELARHYWFELVCLSILMMVIISSMDKTYTPVVITPVGVETTSNTIAVQPSNTYIDLNSIVRYKSTMMDNETVGDIERHDLINAHENKFVGQRIIHTGKLDIIDTKYDHYALYISTASIYDDAKCKIDIDDKKIIYTLREDAIVTIKGSIEEITFNYNIADCVVVMPDEK